MKHWQLIENQPLLRQIYKEPSNISYRTRKVPERYTYKGKTLRIKGYKHVGGKRESGFSLSYDLLQFIAR